jgi:hypothetical protein
MDSLVAQFNVKVEELRVFLYFVVLLCFGVKSLYHQGVIGRGWHTNHFIPNLRSFGRWDPLTGQDQVWKRTYGQSSKMVVGDSIGALGGGVKRGEVWKSASPAEVHVDKSK